MVEISLETVRVGSLWRIAGQMRKRRSVSVGAGVTVRSSVVCEGTGLGIDWTRRLPRREMPSYVLLGLSNNSSETWLTIFIVRDISQAVYWYSHIQEVSTTFVSWVFTTNSLCIQFKPLKIFKTLLSKIFSVSCSHLLLCLPGDLLPLCFQLTSGVFITKSCESPPLSFNLCLSVRI